ncbi:MAG: FAD-dependent oxidoreductase, partial [Firmicutes bacterium]|nr:FAD-dependent oxidoreductase [Bacillota bacterium]
DNVLDEMMRVFPMMPHDDGFETISWLYSEYVINRHITAIEREEVLTSLSDRHQVKLYTNDSSWKAGKIENCGPIDYYDAAPAVFAASDINLNITLRSIKSGIPLRAFDIMGAGGFLMTSFTADFLKFFVPGEDFVFYGSIRELIEKAEAQAISCGAEIIYDDITFYDLSEKTKKLKGEEEYSAKAVILALGALHKKAGFKGEEEYAGKGVSYCAVCDGAFFKEKTAAVIGGANTAVSDALYLADICKKVYIIYRKNELRAEYSLVKRLESKKNIEVIYNSVPVEVVGGKKVEKLITSTKELIVDAVFVAVGLEPNTKALTTAIKLDKDGYIISQGTKTNIKGVFAAGDCRQKTLRQLITAASDGAMAAEAASEYIKITNI